MHFTAWKFGRLQGYWYCWLTVINHPLKKIEATNRRYQWANWSPKLHIFLVMRVLADSLPKVMCVYWCICTGQQGSRRGRGTCLPSENTQCIKMLSLTNTQTLHFVPSQASDVSSAHLPGELDRWSQSSLHCTINQHLDQKHPKRRGSI